MTTGRATGREGRSRRPPSSGRSVCSRASTSCTSLRFCNLRRPPSSPGSGGRRSSSSGEIPRSTWRSSPAAPASPFHTALSAPRQGHTPVHVIGWERVDADTDTDYDRHAYLPQGRPRTAGPTTLTGPYPIAPRQRTTRYPCARERRPRPEQSAESLDPTKSPPRDA